jgi:hypothetical protein
VGLQAEDLDEQHGCRGPKRDDQSRHYAAENVKVIVVIRLTAAVGLRLRSIHGGYSATVVGWTGCICCKRRLNFASCSWVFRLQSQAKDIDLRPVGPSELLDLDGVRVSPHLEVSRENIY